MGLVAAAALKVIFTINTLNLNFGGPNVAARPV